MGERNVYLYSSVFHSISFPFRFVSGSMQRAGGGKGEGGGGCLVIY